MYRDHVKVALILMEYGVDVKAQERDENTSLYWALEWGKLHRVKGENAARLLLKHGADAKALDIKNRTPLHLASGKGRVEVGRVLLEHGVVANARSAGNVTPLHLAASSSKSAHAEI